MHRSFNVMIRHMYRPARTSLSHVHRNPCHYVHPTVVYAVHHRNHTIQPNWYSNVQQCPSENVTKKCASSKRHVNLSDHLHHHQHLDVNQNRTIHRHICTLTEADQFHRFHCRVTAVPMAMVVIIIAAIRKKCIRKPDLHRHPNYRDRFQRIQLKRKRHQLKSPRLAQQSAIPYESWWAKFGRQASIENPNRKRNVHCHLCRMATATAPASNNQPNSNTNTIITTATTTTNSSSSHSIVRTAIQRINNTM